MLPKFMWRPWSDRPGDADFMPYDWFYILIWSQEEKYTMYYSYWPREVTGA